ncbi:pyrroline-5-carboxylate reductase [Alkalispirochaeta americana]|uniref:Pyrroline-5-carboxylate reductase n=1 Tax=Alkalispirochaeta americana TaxID=159291 RepID=A0A1N6NZP8_9SPIO|nr:pyrroline-5-carboxylate reductase [Alkalispirochaeta americana]SIP97467.1 pyrroline-5-carboxylate reductase [Alkalispirochaeta americana]
MKKIGLIGAGFMGTAATRAIRATRPNIDIGLAETDPSRRLAALEEFSASDFSGNPQDMPSWADVVILAVKPKELPGLATAIREKDPEAFNKTFIVSLLAGTTVATLHRTLGSERVIRMMPNLAAQISQSVTGVAFSEALPEESRQEILQLFSGLGPLLSLEEEQIHAITALSGSGIAFALEFIQALTLGGVKEGLPYGQALEAACGVVRSAANLVAHTGQHPQEIVSQVCSPGGTTIEGVHTLAENRFQAAVMEAVTRTARRSRELGKATEEPGK